MARVIVIGAGVVGLSCALRLQQAGHRVDVVARDLPLETTSAVAAAIWYPYRAFPYERVTAWSATTYHELERLAADADTGVRMVEGTELHRRRSRLQSLREIQDRYEGFARGTRAIMQHRPVDPESRRTRGMVWFK